MKYLDAREKKQSLLGLLLMGGLITLFVLLTDGVDSIGVFRLFYPIFWGMFSVLLILSMCFVKRPVFISSNYSLLRFTNVLTFICMVGGYVTSVLPNMSVYYYTYQPLYFTAAIFILMCLYMIGVTRESSSFKNMPYIYPPTGSLGGGSEEDWGNLFKDRVPNDPDDWGNLFKDTEQIYAPEKEQGFMGCEENTSKVVENEVSTVVTEELSTDDVSDETTTLDDLDETTMLEESTETVQEAVEVKQDDTEAKSVEEKDSKKSKAKKEKPKKEKAKKLKKDIVKPKKSSKSSIFSRKRDRFFG